MKPIRQTDKKLSFTLKAVILLVLIAGIAAFVFSLKNSGNAKKAFPDLSISKTLAAPGCSAEGGFYREAISVQLTAPDAATAIYYTTDGSEPSLASTLYSKPIVIENRTSERNYLSAIPTSPRWKPPIDNVFKGTVIRAICIGEKNTKSEELVRTFFVDEKGAERYSLPVVSVTVNEKDLFGYNKGIYVLGKSYTDKDNYIRKNIPLDLPWWEYPSNYLSRGKDSERPAHIEFYEAHSKPGFQADVGLRINGNATRGFSQKSLRVSFREKYGQTGIRYDLFGTKEEGLVSTFILRNSGNDWDKTMFRDGFMQSLMKSDHLDIQEDRPAIVFINGEYWGIHNIRESFDENYVAIKYHLEKEDLVIMKGIGDLLYGDKSDAKEFDDLLAYISKHNLAEPTAYNHVAERLDVESFMEVVIANVYFCNSDWPNNNVKFWRSKKVYAESDSAGKANNRWHWMLNDTDWGFGYPGPEAYRTDLLGKATKTTGIGTIFSGLLQNAEFKRRFLERFRYHLNTTFDAQEVTARINEFQQALAPEITEHIRRWRAIPSYSQWLLNVEIVKAFAQKRPAVQVAQLNAFFGLKGPQQITLKK